MSTPLIKRRRWIRWIVFSVVVVVVLAVAGPYVFIHFIEGPPPAKLSLPTTTTSVGSTANTSTTVSATPASFAGTWNIGAGSIVGYRVSEVLVGQSTTAVGRTTKVWGSAVVSGTTVTAGTFTVDMATVKSDQPQRNAQFDGRIMDDSQYPTATLTLINPLDFGGAPSTGVVTQHEATGDLTMHGVTKSVTFTVSTERTSTGIYLLADIPIKFSQWNIANPSVGGIVTTANNGTLETLLIFTKGQGNPATTTGASSPGFGGSQITVPSTTVPPLNINPKK